MSRSTAPVRLKLIIEPDPAGNAKIDAMAKDGADRLRTAYRKAAKDIGRDLEREIGGVLRRLARAGLDLGRVSPSAARLAASARPTRPDRTVSRGADGGGIVHTGRRGGGVRWSDLADGASAAGGRGAAGLRPLSRALETVARGTSGVHSGLLRMAAGVFLVEKVARGLKAALFDPFAGFIGHVLAATEAERKFQISLSSTLGTMGRARAFSAALNREARGSAFSVATLRQAATALSFNPALRGRLAGGGAAAGVGEASKFAGVVGRLATLDPDQGTQGALTAARELLEGGPTAGVSLRARFGISSRNLARAVAKDYGNDLAKAVSAIQNDPGVALKAVSAYTDSIISDEVLARTSQLASVRFQKLTDGVSEALARVGDSGVYDAAVSKLESLSKNLFSFLDGPTFKSQSRRIGADLARVLDSLGSAVVRFLEKLTGTTAGADTIGAVVGMIGKLIGGLAAASEKLPQVAADLGAGLRGVGDSVAAAVQELRELRGSLLDNPGRTAAAVAKGAAVHFLGGDEIGDVEKVNRATADALARAGVNVGRGYYDPEYGAAQAARDPSVSWGETVDQAVRDALGANAPDEYLDFAGIQDAQTRKLAQEIHRSIGTTGAVPKDLLDQLRAATGARATAAAPAAPDPLAGVPESVRKLIADEVGPVDFSAQLQSVAALLGRIEAAPERDALADLAGKSRGLFSANLGSEAAPIQLDGVIASIRRTAAASAQELDIAIREGTAALATNHNKDLQNWVAKLQSIRGQLDDRTESAVQTIADGLSESAVNFTAGMGAALDGLPAFAESALRERIAAGRGSYQSRVADSLSRAGLPVDRAELGLAGLPLAQQQRETTKIIGARLTALEDAGRVGSLRLGMSPGEVEAAVGARLTDRDVARGQLRYLETGGLARQREQLEKARAAYDPDDERTVGDLARATSEYARLIEQTDDLRYRTNELRQAYDELAAGVRDALEDSIGRGLESIILKTGTAGDALKDLGRSLVSLWSQMATKQLLAGLVGQWGQQVGTTSSGAPVWGQLGGILGGLAGAFTGGGASAGTVKAYAAGGVATGPTFGVFGEQRIESLIPSPGGRVPLAVRGGRLVAALPHGRSIPTTVEGLPKYAAGGMFGAGSYVAPAVSSEPRAVFDPTADDAGGGRGELTINNHVIAVDDRRAAEREAARITAKDRDAVISIVTKDAAGLGRTRRALARRPG